MADEHMKAINQLAQAGRPRPANYDFEHLGNTLSDSMSAAADDVVGEAQRIAEQARKLAAEIRISVKEQSDLLADINSRLKATGEQMLETHRRFNGT